MSRRRKIALARLGTPAFVVNILVLFITMVVFARNNQPTDGNIVIVLVLVVSIVASGILILACRDYVDYQSRRGFSDPGPDFRI